MSDVNSVREMIGSVSWLCLHSQEETDILLAMCDVVELADSLCNTISFNSVLDDHRVRIGKVRKDTLDALDALEKKIGGKE